MVAAPSLPSLQFIESTITDSDTGNSGSFTMIVETLTMHPFKSVTEQLYIPADRLFIELKLDPLFQRYVYGAFPPLTKMVILPSLPPLQLTLFMIVSIVIAESGSTIVNVPDVMEQPFASVIRQVLLPAGKFVAVALVCPLLHKYEYGDVPPVTLIVAKPFEPPKHET